MITRARLTRVPVFRRHCQVALHGSQKPRIALASGSSRGVVSKYIHSCTIEFETRTSRRCNNQILENSRWKSTSTTMCRGLPSYKIARKNIDDFDGHEVSRFPWEDGFEIKKDLIVNADQILEVLGPLMTEERKQRIRQVCNNRTFDVLPILEHPYDWGNVAAVCRTADAMGLGAVHIVRKSENEKYKQSARTSAGAEKWLDIQLHDDTESCLKGAKRRGFQIVVTCLHENAVPPAQIDWTKPTAVVFGSELEGVTDTAMDMADVMCTIPIDGFVESYNISVAAALILWEARNGRISKLGKHGNLHEEESKVLQAIMYLRNKGVFRQYAENLLKRPPPDWQVHRGDWSRKSFDYDNNDANQ